MKERDRDNEKWGDGREAGGDRKIDTQTGRQREKEE